MVAISVVLSAVARQADSAKADATVAAEVWRWAESARWPLVAGAILFAAAAAFWAWHVHGGRGGKIGPLELAAKEDAKSAQRQTDAEPAQPSLVVNLVQNAGSSSTSGTFPTPAGGVPSQQGPTSHTDERSHPHGPSGISLLDRDLFSRRMSELYDVFYARQRYELKSFAINLRVDAAFGLTVELVRDVVACDHPLVAICVERRCPDAALERFEDLNVSFYEDGGKSLMWLPVMNMPHEKRYIGFFREPLLPGQPARRVVTRSIWARSAHKLSRPGGVDEQTFNLPLAAVGVIPSPEIAIDLPTAGGAHYEVVWPEEGLSLNVPGNDGATTCRIPLGDSSPGRKVRLSIVRHR